MPNRIANNRGQIFSTDLIFAVSVFLLLLAFVWYSWDDLNYEMDRKMELSEMKQRALDISDALAMASGSPDNWALDPEGANSIGLVTLPRQLSDEKWSALAGMDYKDQKGLLGVGRFDFWLAVKSGGAVLNSTGLEPAGDFRVGIERAVIRNGEAQMLSLVLWEDYKSSFMTYDYYRGNK